MSKELLFTVVDTMPVRIDYGRSIKDILATNPRWKVYSNYIIDDMFPSYFDVVTTDFHLLDFNGVSFERASHALPVYGFRPASLSALLALVETYPRKYEQVKIIATGSMLITGNETYVLCTFHHAGCRGIGLHPIGSSLRGCLVLATRM